MRRLAVMVAVMVTVTAGSACGDEIQRVDVGELIAEAVDAQFEGRRQDAEERFDEVVRVEPVNRVALYNLGILRRARGDVAGAIEAFTQLLDAHPDFTVARLQRAISLQSSGDLQGAIADLRLVLEQEPDNAEARTQLGALLVATGEVDEGEALLGG
jgi:Flp pilus assembly protein TadD